MGRYLDIYRHASGRYPVANNFSMRPTIAEGNERNKG